MTHGQVVVIGSAGMLGGVLARELRLEGHEVRGLRRTDFNIGVDPVESIDLNDTKCVVNAAGIINRRFALPAARSEAKAVNTTFPHALSAYCASRDVPMIHVSTDCVFDGLGGPYNEQSTPAAKDEYGTTKLAGEPKDCLVLRTSIVGPEIHHGYSLLCWFLQQRDECLGYRNHLWNGVTSLEFSKCISSIIRTGLFETRVQHVFGEDLSKFELLTAFAEVFDHPIRIKATDAEQRDTRLRTVYSDKLAGVAAVAKPMSEQLLEIRVLCDPFGRWSPGDAAANVAHGADSQ